MAIITLRAVKGQPLSIAETDANFTNLNTDKIERVLSVNDVLSGIKITQTGAGAALEVVTGSSVLKNTSVTTFSYSGEATTTGTSSFQVPVGTTAQRPAVGNGKIRYNTSTGAIEGYSNSTWVSLDSTSIVDDITSNAVRYLTFTDQTSGAEQTLNVSSTKLSYVPLTGTLTSTKFSGSSVDYKGSTSGIITVVAPAVAGTNTITLPATTGTLLTSADTGSITSAMIADGAIVNSDINAAAGIVDTKLATIATAGKVANSATTAASANTASAIVARDASGNFSAGTITATLNGTATNQSGGTVNATTIAYSGDVTTTSTTALQVPVGTAAQRPTGANGKIRYNSSINGYEGYVSSTSSWAQFGPGAEFAQQSLTPNGYQRLPGGLILQWGVVGNGTANNAGFTGTVTYPIAFPTSILNVFLQVDESINDSGGTSARLSSPSPSRTQFSWTAFVGGSLANIDRLRWFAIGT